MRLGVKTLRQSHAFVALGKVGVQCRNEQKTGMQAVEYPRISFFFHLLFVVSSYSFTHLGGLSSVFNRPSTSGFGMDKRGK